jgi:hypothetical protein
VIFSEFHKKLLEQNSLSPPRLFPSSTLLIVYSTFQLHLVEGPNAGITWSSENWLQYDNENENKNNGGGSGSSSSSSSHTNFLRLLDYA